MQGGKGAWRLWVLTFVRNGGPDVTADPVSPADRFDALGSLENDPGPVDLAVIQDTTEPEVEALVARVRSEHGRLDVLFNNAGIYEPGEVHETSEEAWDRQIGVNLKSVYLVSHHVVPVMLEQGGGAIVNNASVAALVGDLKSAAYCASKGGVGMLTRAMALDYAQRGIRVNAICCGEIDTPLFVKESYQIGMTPDSYREILNEAHPIGRIGLPSEAAAAVAYLASDDASFLTGVLLPVDGGYSAV